MFYQHKSMNCRNHGAAEYEAKEEERRKQRVMLYFLPYPRLESSCHSVPSLIFGYLHMLIFTLFITYSLDQTDLPVQLITFLSSNTNLDIEGRKENEKHGPTSITGGIR